ncbi:hypothetical protein BDP27DRAFT_1364167 [Rhodocollybia butyracea]|uniref:Uncharacterized protein n=1 Tax=Rhodocollybia butyracea TaxID=206335 RepID=A0A9P5PMD3_9AGAR|nr:hypothetical protein BDP27DRAFT_1364167 [Rhodocollybia butyracea]
MLQDFEDFPASHVLYHAYVTRTGSYTLSVYDHLLQSPEKIEFFDYCVPSINFKDASNLVSVLSFVLVNTFSSVIIALAMKRTVWDFRRYSHSLFSVLNKDGLKVFSAIGVHNTLVNLVKSYQGNRYSHNVYRVSLQWHDPPTLHTLDKLVV